MIGMEARPFKLLKAPVVTGYASSGQSVHPEDNKTCRGIPAPLARRQGTAETSNLTSLVGQNADEFKTVKESHAMADDCA